ncbi:hypothetical protein RSAG8_11885, partial [Rhizoctonia solani AG-8 WAC10335]
MTIQHWYDVDFRLPDGDDEELNDEPDDEPDHEDHPGAQYTAFQEPALTRNSYINAFVQESMYGATQRALEHQLKSARRTLTTHPNIHVEDIARMAQSMCTVEKGPGVYADRLRQIYPLPGL